ncbi:ABC transporter ATP-binding protein [Wielerella bovis]|uniref:ABC transporter ATP-binding protein n=1 Tax=Wielerella bovis TaxID=2917790 RepID=UPI0020199D34|nr:ABC transporter ATP-binding protein [Wielerella bovis]ULJ60278.1 ABC transporter ATP-binding protein [Wielerella bovis]
MLQLVHIYKSFQHKTVAHDISFTVANGSITAILGASGSGKSTLLNMIAGLTHADSGDIVLDNVSQKNRQPENRHVAMMFQDFALLPYLNVWQNVAFGLRMRGVDKASARHTAQQLLSEVGLDKMAERQIDALSGGEKQRVALARALAGEPKILLLDEPFSSLDTTLRTQLQTLTRDLVRRKNIPALLVTHDPAEACFMADTLALMAEGKLLQLDTPDAILARPIDARAARLLGCWNVSDAHYVPPDAVRVDENGVLCAVRECFRLPLGWRVTVAHPQWGDLVFFADKLLSGGECAVWVDESQIVFFIVDSI